MVVDNYQITQYFPFSSDHQQTEYSSVLLPVGYEQLKTTTAIKTCYHMQFYTIKENNQINSTKMRK
jgi:hypothetical protein